jgi:hypothetical protein
VHLENLLLTESRTRQVQAKATLKYYNLIHINEETLGVLFVIFLCDDAKNLYHMRGFFDVSTRPFLLLV